ncbi:Sm-like ribonucleo protein [Sistotremastrum niveocremeum HHB9708]|uniref:Small nuclear ribonucleoprotein E n=2 Tax=Sistotremastraceae TaxID=3402574 RepID=A0A164R9W6_9AGAM|nr:Sm-like ribonucleo protein [Sistotremastrum niveocremeum HHB9708]KZT42723.1 Sm-like ribonucleo protein [Sistotremastrum suecicum HHB10207 ss-3]
MSGRQQRVMVQPINVIFKNLQQRQNVSVWLYDNVEMRIEGKIIGFDEFMNIVLDDAEEAYVKDVKPRRPLGRILLKGDSITLIQQIVKEQ